MTFRAFASVSALAAAAALVALVPSPVVAQATKSAAKSAKAYTPPKTPWGDPDIQGLWPATSSIPMQRPDNLKGRAELTDAEIAQREAQAQRQAAADSEQAPSSGGGNVTINPPGYWVERGKVNRQSSLVVDPPDGKIPPMTPQGQAFVKALREGKGPGDHFPKVVDSFDDFDFYSRCITRGIISSMLPTLYNFGNEIIQGPGYVAIRNEMIHETRVIPINSSAHAGKDVRSYMGDSRGHWEGNTLVIETTNFNDKTGAGGGYFTKEAKITERITRVGPEELKYEATINDPNTWTKPWTINMPYYMDLRYPVYEYACHEGNYMMIDSLVGARKLEQEGKSTFVDRNAGTGAPRNGQ
jgi:hypothetical protein